MNNVIIINNRAYNIIVNHTCTAYPQESCGVLLIKKKPLRYSAEGSMFFIHNALILDNEVTQSESGTHFAISPVTMLRIEKELENVWDIAGFYHSHPDAAAVPSKEDIRYMIPGMLYIILSVTADGCKCMRGYIRRQADEEVCEITIIREVAV